MAIEIKIILTVIFLVFIAGVLFVDPKNPGPSHLWWGNKKLLRTISDDDILKEGTKPFFVVLFIIFFGMCIYLLWTAA
jgi:hypothetical protein